MPNGFFPPRAFALCCAIAVTKTVFRIEWKLILILKPPTAAYCLTPDACRLNS